MTWTITGRVLGVIKFPEHPEHIGAHGLNGGEDIHVERSTFRSTTDAARWCERILDGRSPRPRWKAYGEVLEPHVSPEWDTAEIVVREDGTDDILALYEWTGSEWRTDEDAV